MCEFKVARCTMDQWHLLRAGYGQKSHDGVSSKHLDALFVQLMQECRHNAPGARFSAKLRSQLERLPLERRRNLVSRTRDGCAPLFVAARRGAREALEYLIVVMDAKLEQRGIYSVTEERSSHVATPLWAAAVGGHLAAVRTLADAGAELDAPSDSGSTPLRSACFMTHLAVVKFLVSRGADIHRPNHNGGTCLINAVQSVKLVRFLLEAGAKVDARDVQRKTALHYAIQEHRLDSAKALLEAGASPVARCAQGDDALRLAACKGAPQIVSLLSWVVSWETWRVADAYELLGAAHLDEFNDPAAARAAWRQATALRHTHSGYIEKTPVRPPVFALRAREWRTMADLDSMSHDELRMQALLVLYRVLGTQHKDTVFRLMYRGAAYADAFHYKRCVELWTWALELRIRNDTIVYTEACQTLCALTRLLLDAHSGRLQRSEGVPRHQHVLAVYMLLHAHLPEAARLVAVRPLHRKHAEMFDRALRCATHLLYLLLATAATHLQRAHVVSLARVLVSWDLRSVHTCDSLLHLVASRLNVVRSTYFADDMPPPHSVFPDPGVARLLLAAGADPQSRNTPRSTPLHVAAIPYNYSPQLMEVLLKYGGHLDQRNKFGESAARLVAIHGGAGELRLAQRLSLACRSASALADLAHSHPLYLEYVNNAIKELPKTLQDFYLLHC